MLASAILFRKIYFCSNNEYSFEIPAYFWTRAPTPEK